MQDVATAESRPGIGDNLPPTEAESIQSALAERHEPLVKRRDELLKAASRVPETVGGEHEAGKFGDFIKQLAAAVKNAEAARVAEKEPHLEGGRAVDGFFKPITEPLAKIKKEIESRLGVYLRAKEKAERERREEEERKAREEEKRLADEAAEKLKAAEDAKGLDDAVAADEAAKEASEAAARAKAAAEVKPAELSRTRGDHGSVSSLREHWTLRDLNRATLDLEALRHHIPTDALEKAVRSYIKAGGRELNGVVIFDAAPPVVR